MLFCGFNIHILIFIFSPNLDNLVKIQQFFILNIMRHLKTCKQKIPIIELLNQAKEKIFQQMNMQVLLTNKQHSLPLNQQIELEFVSIT